jgi:hypothetical protein
LFSHSAELDSATPLVDLTQRPPRSSESLLSYFSLILAAGPGVAVQPFSREGPVETFNLEDFEGYPVQSFPEKWRRRSEAARKIYRVESENGNHFLHAYADKQSVQIGLEQLFDPAKFRRLSWRWRVHALPQGADERMAGKHNAAAQVYVVFDNQYLPRVIKYIWSAGLPAGTGFTKSALSARPRNCFAQRFFRQRRMAPRNR